MTDTVTEGCPVVDFDPHTPEFVGRFRQQVTEIHEQDVRVAWTPHYGGAWLISGMDEILEVSRNNDTFSSWNGVTADGIECGGVTMPTMPIPPQVPIELDPPNFWDYRRMIAQPLSPKAVERLRSQITAFTNWCLDRHVGNGSMDLVLDLAGPVPALTTLAFMGLPMDDWEAIAQVQHELMYTPQSDPHFAAVVEGIGRIEQMVEAELSDRRAHPRGDLLSHLANAKIDGELAPMKQLLSLCSVMIAGGVDTTTALIGNAFIHLDEHPDERQRLIDEPSMMWAASNEFLRFFTPVQRHCRTVLHDITIGGQPMRPGDRVILYWTGANFDPRTFPEPDKVILDRTPNRHAAFGLGIHRCAGSHLARLEFEVVLGEALKRIPDYQIDREKLERYPTVGIVNGYVRVPATFTAREPERAPSDAPPLLAGND